MSLVIYNTLSREKEPFAPLDAGHVRMYVCGPTVYDYVHIGNARPVVVFDVLYRLLKRRYPRVTYVRNITDIDDRIMVRAADNGETIDAVTYVALLVGEGLRPTRDYLGHLLAGRDLLPGDYWEQLRATRTLD